MAYLSSVAAFGFKDIPTQKMLAVFRELGCRRTQFYRNEHNPPAPADARRMALDAGLPFDSVHGVFGPQYDPSSPDPQVRRLAVDVYRREGELAVELGGPMVVVHPAPAAPDLAAIAPAQPARQDALLRSLEELAAIGQDLGVIYLIENLPGNYWIGSQPAQLAAMLRQFNHPHIRMCFDTGHAHMTARVADALAQCADLIAYLHVHDNDAKADSHMIPGEGTLPWDALSPIMARLPQQTPAMIELFHDEATFRQAMSHGLAQRLTRWLSLPNASPLQEPSDAATRA